MAFPPISILGEKRSKIRTGAAKHFEGLAAPVLILERFSLKIEMGGKAILGLSRLDYLLAKTGGTVNGGV